MPFFLLFRPELEPEIIYLRHVERAKPHKAPAEGDKIYPPPQFIVPLRDVTQIESGKVHFEARIEPVGDPTMRVDWYRNGRLVEASKLRVLYNKCISNNIKIWQSLNRKIKLVFFLFSWRPCVGPNCSLMKKALTANRFRSKIKE